MEIDTSVVVARARIGNLFETRDGALCAEPDLDGGFAILQDYVDGIATRRAAERLQNGRPDVPETHQALENAYVLEEAAVGLAEEAESIDEAVLVAMWLMYRDGYYKLLEYETLVDWAVEKLGHIYAEKTLARKCYSVENIIARVWAREEQGDPIVVPGDEEGESETLTVDKLIRMSGLTYRMQQLAPVFAMDDLTPEEENETFRILTREKDRTAVRDHKDKMLGRAVVKLRWWEKPVGMNDEGEELYIPQFPPMTKQEIGRLERLLGGVGEKLTNAPS